MAMYMQYHHIQVYFPYAQFGCLVWLCICHLRHIHWLADLYGYLSYGQLISRARIGEFEVRNKDSLNFSMYTMVVLINELRISR